MKKEKEGVEKTRSVDSLGLAILLIAVPYLVLVQVEVLHWLVIVGRAL